MAQAPEAGRTRAHFLGYGDYLRRNDLLLSPLQRGSTNSSSSQAPLITTITSAPNSTKGFTPSARTISKPASARPASRMALAIRKERKRRIGFHHVYGGRMV